MFLCEICREELILGTSINHNNIIWGEIEWELCKKCGDINIEKQKIDLEDDLSAGNKDKMNCDHCGQEFKLPAFWGFV